MLVSGANRHDSLFVGPILDGMPTIKLGGRGHPRRRPIKLHADKGYDNPRVRRYLRRRRISARIARIGGTPAPGSAGTAGSWSLARFSGHVGLGDHAPVSVAA